MGYSSSPAVLAGKLSAAAGLLKEVPAIGTKGAVELVRLSVLAQLGGTKTLRGVGRRGARIGVKTNVIGAGESVIGEAQATGPFQLIERDTRAHVIPKARRKRRVVVIPGVGPRHHANHPGTRGKHPWARGVAAARPKIDEAYERAVHSAFASVF